MCCDPDDADVDLMPVHQVRVGVGQWRSGSLPGPCSVFGLADQLASQDATSQAGAIARPCRRVDEVTEHPDRRVVRGLSYPSGRMTVERAERERERRAKQVPPKPSAAAGFKVRKRER